MKHTVKLNSCSTFTTLPTNVGTILVEINTGGAGLACFSLTPDQAGAIIFGLEMAMDRICKDAEASQLSQEGVPA